MMGSGERFVEVDYERQLLISESRDEPDSRWVVRRSASRDSIGFIKPYLTSPSKFKSLKSNIEGKALRLNPYLAVRWRWHLWAC